jgi:triacylglycerol lipase
MIARITRILLLLQLAVAAAIAAGAIRVLGVHAMGGAAIGIGFVLLLRLAITANNFSLAWRFRSVTPKDHVIGLSQSRKLFFGEYLATMTASSWSMPFRRFSKRIAQHPKTLPVLLIHGYGCNSGYWRPMSKALTEAGISHHAIDLEPVMGSIDDYAPMIRRAVEDICRGSGYDRIIVVAHSMGGLATRAYIRKYGIDRIATAITLGTPHHGTALAHYGIGVNSAQMRWALVDEEELASEWLQQLAETESAAVRARFVSLYSHHDNIIAPQTSSQLPGANNVAFHGIGHVALASHPAIQARVIEEIRRIAN